MNAEERILSSIGDMWLTSYSIHKKANITWRYCLYALENLRKKGIITRRKFKYRGRICHKWRLRKEVIYERRVFDERKHKCPESPIEKFALP